MSFVSSVHLNDEKDAIILLDQTLLPNEEVFLKIENKEDLWEAVKKLRVRGAPAIGIAAAYGAYIGIRKLQVDDFSIFYDEFKRVKEYLATSRPTAVNLFWALNRMEKVLLLNKDKSIDELKELLLKESEEIRKEDEEVCKSIGEYSLELIESAEGVLTHCNAGGIATAKYGTALAPLYLAEERGKRFKVYIDETRPLLQGSRLTSWEVSQLSHEGILICDNMAATVMKEGKVQAVLVGCDRVAANGDAANKIGTLGVAILAKNYSIPFYVHAPLSTIDIETESGRDIVIEERGEEEIKKIRDVDLAPSNINTYNPAFDVTDNELITAIITEKGVVYPPFKENIKKLFEN